MSIVASCSAQEQKENNQTIEPVTEDIFRIYTLPADTVNRYSGFNSNLAINRIADIENEYFNNRVKSQSRYYGTIWKQYSDQEYLSDSTSTFDKYEQALIKRGLTSDSMHCTIYAMKALKAGLDSNFTKVNSHHKRLYGKHEFAGWSIGYILTKYYNWKAYLIVSENSEEYDRCIRNFRNKKNYYVWKRPDIPLAGMFDFYSEHDKIDSLLKLHEFGWGFSYQGMHTWITRYDTLKECDWTGPPAIDFDPTSSNPLFRKTKFTNYEDYSSHIIVFPPKKEKFK